jgi:hypothetical protein
MMALERAGAWAGRKLRAMKQREEEEAASKARLAQLASMEPMLLAPPSEQAERRNRPN